MCLILIASLQRNSKGSHVHFFAFSNIDFLLWLHADKRGKAWLRPIEHLHMYDVSTTSLLACRKMTIEQ
jgi:hypothetical protein